MTLEGVVTNYHSDYFKSISILTRIEENIKLTVINKMLESISFNSGRSIKDNEIEVQLEFFDKCLFKTIDIKQQR